MSKTNKKVVDMNNEAIKDFYNIIYMLDTILCALKWQRLQNNIGCPDE